MNTGIDSPQIPDRIIVVLDLDVLTVGVVEDRVHMVRIIDHGTVFIGPVPPGVVPGVVGPATHLVVLKTHHGVNLTVAQFLVLPGAVDVHEVAIVEQRGTELGVTDERIGDEVLFVNRP